MVMCGHSAYDWKTRPRLRPSGGTALRGFPSKKTWSPTRMVPDSGFSRPATQESVVDLPQPDGPSGVKNSPSSTVKLMS